MTVTLRNAMKEDHVTGGPKKKIYLPVNTFVYSRAVIQGVSIRTGLDKRLVYMAIKLLWLKPYKHYVTQKGSRLTSAQSYITGLYSVKYSPLYIINSC